MVFYCTSLKTGANDTNSLAGNKNVAYCFSQKFISIFIMLGKALPFNNNNKAKRLNNRENVRREFVSNLAVRLRMSF